MPAVRWTPDTVRTLREKRQWVAYAKAESASWSQTAIGDDCPDASSVLAFEIAPAPSPSCFRIFERLSELAPKPQSCNRDDRSLGYDDHPPQLPPD